MKNILLIGYCYFQDGFLYAMNELEKYGNKIYFFPYFTYILDNNEKRDDILIEYIKSNNINICLWWNNRLKYDSIKYVIDNLNDVNQKNIKNYFYNWDPYLYNYEDYNCIYWKDVVENITKIYELMDYTFSCFEYEINYMTKYMTNYNSEYNKKINISYLPSGFNPSISNYIYDEKYICDVSIVCTNIYNDKSMYPNESCNLHRYEIIDKLYENRHKINFFIYGNDKIEKMYPECYKGFIKYEDCNRVFSNSKINLSIHCLTECVHSFGNSTQEYFSERVPQILGCKGLLMTNTYYSHLLKEDISYIYVNNNNFLHKIFDILQNYSYYEKIKTHGYNIAINNYTWNIWSNKINNIINQNL
jgi:hypothetical protein